MTEGTFDLAAEIAKETAAELRAARGKATLEKMVLRYGAMAVAGWLHGVIYATPVNDKCKEHCRDGRVTIGSYTVVVPSTAPCPICRPLERATYMENDPMAADERAYYARGGKNWAGD